MPNSNFVPAYDHIVVVVEENHSYTEIIGNSQAPYINSLAHSGALLSGYNAVAHPSEPNYFALYAGSTFGVTDDGIHNEPGPTLGSVLSASGRTFVGYVESGSPSKHNPWESFPEGFSVEQSLSSFPSDFSRLPTVSFVVPNLADDMHDGTIAQGDAWLRSHIDAYAQWAVANNSLLVITFDEDDNSASNRVPTILLGAHIASGTYSSPSNHFDLLHTILQASGLPAPNNAANASGLDPAVFLNVLFGTITHDASSASGQIYTAYDGLLGRPPDLLDLESWAANFQNGSVSARGLVHALLSSQEFTNHFGQYTQIGNQAFVEDLYDTALHRAGDPQGEQAWTNALASGLSRDEVAYDFVFSAEHESDLASAFNNGVFVPNGTGAAIARLFYALLDRPPDGGGLQFWENQAAHDLPLQSIAQDFISSSEYQHRHGPQTDQQFVDALYQGALGRPADPGGEATWVLQLTHGAARGEVALGIAESAEAQAHLAPVIENSFRLV